MIHPFLLLYNRKQQVLLEQQQIFRSSNLVGSKQQLVLIFSYLELVNFKLKIPSSSTLMLIEQYSFFPLSKFTVDPDKYFVFDRDLLACVLVYIIPALC
jgi:hypothetical protein